MNALAVVIACGILVVVEAVVSAFQDLNGIHPEIDKDDIEGL